MSSGGGGRVGGTNFQLLMLSSNLLKKNFFCENFLSFRTKSITVLFSTLSTKWLAYRRTTNITCQFGMSDHVHQYAHYKIRNEVATLNIDAFGSMSRTFHLTSCTNQYIQRSLTKPDLTIELKPSAL